MGDDNTDVKISNAFELDLDKCFTRENMEIIAKRIAMGDRNMNTVSIHIIDEGSNKVISRVTKENAPLVGDEIRLGGEGNETIYKVTRRVWAYDEVDALHRERLNIGVVEVT